MQRRRGAEREQPEGQQAGGAGQADGQPGRRVVGVFGAENAGIQTDAQHQQQPQQVKERQADANGREDAEGNEKGTDRRQQHAPGALPIAPDENAQQAEQSQPQPQADLLAQVGELGRDGCDPVMVMQALCVGGKRFERLHGLRLSVAQQHKGCWRGVIIQP